MLINCGNNAVKKKCRNPQGKFARRLDDIRAAANMAVLMTLPGRCHPLRADRKGQWAMDLDHPVRLVFEPILGDQRPDEDGRIDLAKVTGIRIVEIGDYHD